MSDPIKISRDQQRSAYVALGLDPDAFDVTKSVLIEANAVTVVRSIGEWQKTVKSRKIPIEGD